MMLRIEAPHYVAGLVLAHDICVRAAPILKWARGKHKDYLLSYFKRKGYTVTIHA